MDFARELRTLNPDQRKAVETIHGRLLILAGAGSGKTRVLTLRMAYLIHEIGLHPKRILGLTFTNKAAHEMRERLSSFIGPKLAKQVTLSTFHSFCLELLRQHIHYLGYTPHFSLYDEQDVQRLVNLIARDELETEGELPSLSPTLQAIRGLKNKGVQASQYIPESNSPWHDRFVQKVYERLDASMRAYNAVDFDHLLFLAVELLQSQPAVLQMYRDQYEFVMIDEYQDTNPTQDRLASLLSAPKNNLCVVGDDDQSIYGWRGAEIRNILEFPHDTRIILSQNYRSTNGILKGANAVIQHNSVRYTKALWSDRGDGEKIEVFFAPTEKEEAQGVVKRLIKKKEQLSLQWKDCAILYRSNILSRTFEEALLRETWHGANQWIQGIPYEVYGGTEFYERKEIKDVCAYLRLIVNRADEEALLRVINQPRRGIGEETLDRWTTRNRREKKPLWDICRALAHNLEADQMSTRARQGLVHFVSTIEEGALKFQQEGVARGIEWLVEQIDYARAIREEVKSEQMRRFKQDNVNNFIASLSEGADLSLDGLTGLSTLLHQFSLLDGEASFRGKRRVDDAVQLMTFHSAKGLEFPVCFLVGLEDHILPHEKSIAERGLEEERRLLYVAMTRARQQLTLSMAQTRKRMGKDVSSRPSRFLFEIPKELLRSTDWRFA